MAIAAVAVVASAVWHIALGGWVMTDVIESFTLDIPAGNGSGGAWFIDCNLGVSEVTEIMLVFPPGCSGLVGAQLQFAIQPVYPSGLGGWFVLDDYVLRFPVTNQGNSGQWRLVAYNTDVYDHTIHCYFFYNYVNLSVAQSQSPLIAL